MSAHHGLGSSRVRSFVKLGVDRRSLDAGPSLGVLAGSVTSVHHLQMLNQDLVSSLLLDHGLGDGLVDDLGLLEGVLAVHVAESWQLGHARLVLGRVLVNIPTELGSSGFHESRLIESLL